MKTIRLKLTTGKTKITKLENIIEKNVTNKDKIL